MPRYNTSEMHIYMVIPGYNLAILLSKKGGFVFGHWPTVIDTLFIDSLFFFFLFRKFRK